MSSSTNIQGEGHGYAVQPRGCCSCWVAGCGCGVGGCTTGEAWTTGVTWPAGACGDAVALAFLIFCLKSNFFFPAADGTFDGTFWKVFILY